MKFVCFKKRKLQISLICGGKIFCQSQLRSVDFIDRAQKKEKKNMHYLVNEGQKKGKFRQSFKEKSQILSITQRKIANFANQ